MVMSDPADGLPERPEKLPEFDGVGELRGVCRWRWLSFDQAGFPVFALHLNVRHSRTSQIVNFRACVFMVGSPVENISLGSAIPKHLVVAAVTLVM